MTDDDGAPPTAEATTDGVDPMDPVELKAAFAHEPVVRL
jgi:hypothetical protein